MAYAAKADLQQRLAPEKLTQLTDFSGTGEADDARIDEALGAASAVIDSYAGGRYALPLAASDQVRDLALALAIHKLYEFRQREVPETVKAGKEAAMALLKDVAAGKATLDQPAKKQTVSSEAVKKDHTTEPDVFDDDRLDKF